MTRLCVPIFVRDIEQALADVARAGEAGADLVELRIDQLTDPADVQRVVAGSILPAIVTCRPTWEGGQSELDTAARLKLLSTAAASGAAYVDVEVRSLAQQNAPASGAQTIVSTHDFQGRPDRLLNLVLQLNDAGGEVNKIVWTARTIRDNIEAFEILLNKQKPTVALCMGEAGLLSRVLARKFAAFATFATLSNDQATAPGQLTIADMRQLYRWDAIQKETRVFGVVGSPVAHSMSPAIHNASFDAVGFDGVYVPMLVNEGYESFKAFMETFVRFAPLHLCGLSVTIPHKENALRYLEEIGAAVDPLADRIGALNTIVITRPGDGANAGGAPTLRGFSSDYAAILDTITTSLAISRDDLARHRVAVIGAGGTGRTAVAALAETGATVVVYNRTRTRADALAAEFNGRSGKVVAAPMEKLCDSCCQIYINTTSMGMTPDVDASPFGDQTPTLTPDHLVFDCVYNPMRTKFLQQGADAGAKTVGGVEMFVRQAAAQFTAWTGLEAPISLMRQVVEARLAPT